MQRGVAVIPKAVEEKHLRENLAALNVELDAGDMAAIASIGKNERFLTADVFEIGPYQGMDILRDEGLFLCLTRQTGKRYFVDRGGFSAIILFSLATERITEENKMFGKKLEIKIDKMPAINKSGKIDMRGKENAVEATVTNLSDADRVLKVSCYIHLDNDPDFPDIPYLEVKMAFKDGIEEVKDSWSRRIEQEHASGDVICRKEW